MNGLRDSFAVVVGGSRGLGASVAAALHSAGSHVVAVSRNPVRGTEWEQARVDATDEQSVESFFASRSGQFRDLNFLVSFAGVRYNKAIVDSSVEQWRECVDASLLSSYLALRAFARTCRGRRGSVVQMASIHADAAAPGRSAYGAAKAAVVQLTAIAAVELAPAIRVNCIAPGFIRTEASDEMIASGKLDGEGIARRTPLQRLGMPDEIVSATLFLLSDDASFITGETLRADGGWLRHAVV